MAASIILAVCGLLHWAAAAYQGGWLVGRQSSNRRDWLIVALLASTGWAMMLMALAIQR